MPRVMIKQLEERVSTQGLHMGGGTERRKLQPGEIVDIPEDLMTPNGGPLLDILWQTGKLEMTLDKATRPLDFADATEAKYTAPNFKPRGPDEQVSVDKARAAVAARMAEIESVVPKSEKTEGSPAVDDKVPARPAARGKQSKATTAPNRRAARRAALAQAKDGEAITT